MNIIKKILGISVAFSTAGTMVAAEPFKCDQYHKFKPIAYDSTGKNTYKLSDDDHKFEQLNTTYVYMDTKIDFDSNGYYCASFKTVMSDQDQFEFYRQDQSNHAVNPETQTFSTYVFPNSTHWVNHVPTSVVHVDTRNNGFRSKTQNSAKYQTFQMSFDCKKGEIKFYKNGTLFAHSNNTAYKGCDVGVYRVRIYTSTVGNSVQYLKPEGPTCEKKLHECSHSTKLLEQRQLQYFDKFEKILSEEKHDLKKMFIEMASKNKELEAQNADLKNQNANLETDVADMETQNANLEKEMAALAKSCSEQSDL